MAETGSWYSVYNHFFLYFVVIIGFYRKGSDKGRADACGIWFEKCLTIEKMKVMERKGKKNLISKQKFSDKLLELVREVKAEGRYSTAANYRHTCSSFFLFLRDTGSDFLLNGLLMERYERWLWGRRVSRNSSSFYMRNLRAMCNVLAKKGVIADAGLFANVYTGVAKTRKRAVAEGVLARVRDADLTRFPKLAYCRDLFLFSFYCRGMAFVDIAYLRWRDIEGEYIYYTRHKTGQRLEVRIEPCMREIMRRYAGSAEYVFSILTAADREGAYRQYRAAICSFNRTLKSLSKLLDIPVLSSYMSRHSWATIARNKQIPLSVISEGMGHNSESTTQIYLASFNQQVVDEANRSVISI